MRWVTCTVRALSGDWLTAVQLLSRSRALHWCAWEPLPFPFPILIPGSLSDFGLIRCSPEFDRLLVVVAASLNVSDGVCGVRLATFPRRSHVHDARERELSEARIAPLADASGTETAYLAGGEPCIGQ